MQLRIFSPPASEPVSLQEIKDHLRLDSGAFVDNLTAAQSIAPGSHIIAADYVTHVGTYADVLGYQAIVVLDSGTNGATGTVDVKIQESDDHTTWTDWTGGAFTQVTTANDNAIQKIAYTGNKQYIRPVAKVLLAACEFGVQILTYESDATEDALLTKRLKAVRGKVEKFTRRALITQTWDAYLDAFPRKNFISLPFGQLQSIASGAFTYTDSGGTVTTMVVTTDYLLDTVSEPGRIVLPYGVSWPSFTAYPVNPIAIRFVCGYGLAVDVPEEIKTSILFMLADIYSERGEKIIGNYSVTDNKWAEDFLWPFRLFEF